MKKNIWRRRLAAAMAGGAVMIGASPAWAVEYANIDVVDGAISQTDAPTVTIPAGQGTAGFFIDPGSVPGEIPVRFGASAADDFAGGVLIASVREILKTPTGATQALSATASTVPDDDATSVNTRNVSGGLAIVTDRAGNDAAGAAYPLGGPMNVNVAAAYFPFSEGWKGGTVWSSVQNAINLDMFAGSAGIQLGTHVKPNYFFDTPFDQSDANDLGNHFVSIPGVTDSRQQGILLTMHAKNEDNFTAVSPTVDGDGWQVNTRGNAQDSPSLGESKPFSFVFVPLGTPNVTMGAIWGAAGPANEPVPVLKSGANFSIVKTAASGTYRLTIDGQTPSSGSLIVQTGSSLTGQGGLPADNIVPYKPDGDGWIITSDDMANINQGGENQNGASSERIPYFQFVFMPFNAQPGAPTIQAAGWDKTSVFSFDIGVTQITNGNDQDDVDSPTTPTTTPGPDMYTTLKAGTAGLNIVPSRMNKGDNAVHVNGALPTAADGVMLTTISQGLRDNTATGGASAEFGVASASITGAAAASGVPGQWEVHTHRTGLVAVNEELNIDYAVAFFGRNSGFPMANAVPTAASGNGHLDLNISGVNSETAGVLMVNPEGNAARFATAQPKAGGGGWDVDVKTVALLDPGATAAVNYVFLPYETENLVAGRVNANGSIVNSTGVGTAPGQFTLTRDSAGQYILTVAGRTPSQGMLLLTPGAGIDGLTDNTMAYEAFGNSFRIMGIDLITQADKDGGAFTDFQDTAFSFAFIDYLTPPELAGPANFLAADFNQNGVVDGADLTAWKSGFGTGTTKAQGDANADGKVDGADFLVWQRQFGQLPPSAVAAGVVPEPAAFAMALSAVGALAFRRRRS
ncbi:dockerin type I domain-containing protein [Lacipirellula sp.]|uniref:dockerin type I domain-containing protein n=1 Tax=Lacipirellula sp. TaxID=2691419 RepID=UPI003D139F3E